jgi:pyruvate,water dikinase
MNYIKFLDKNEEVDRKSVGGKAFALFELLKLGLNVPKGFVITTNAFKIYKNSMIPQSVESEIYEAYDILNCERVAVRSSATLEDSKNSSFAGVFETVLNVTREDLIESVKKVYASLDNAAGYNKSGLMAVIIQEMIDSDFAGVVFTKNPLTKENEFVVEVVSGLGEALVSGVVNSTQYIVKNNSVRLVRNPLQEFKLVVKSRGVEVKKIKNKVKLSKNIILELVRKSMIIEKKFPNTSGY